MDDQEIRERRAEIRRRIEAATNQSNAATNAAHRRHIALRNEACLRYRAELVKLKAALHQELDEIDRRFYEQQDSIAYELTALDDQRMRDAHLEEERRVLERLEAAEVDS
jgi:hypothetical protein